MFTIQSSQVWVLLNKDKLQEKKLNCKKRLEKLR